MNQDALERQLAELPLGGIKFFETTSSTNDQAFALSQEGVPHRFLVIANEQRKGRGRLGRSWFTPPNSALAFSLILYPQNNLAGDVISRMTGLGALAVCEGLRKAHNLSPKIKWPNDVLLDGKKVCGILAEGHWIGEELQTVVIGIGINIAHESVPAEELLNFPATCVEAFTQTSVDRIIVLKHILGKILQWEDKVSEPEFISAWDEQLAFVGEHVQIKQEDQVIQEGKLIGLDPDGKLVLDTQYGEEAVFMAGEIHLRPSIDR